MFSNPNVLLVGAKAKAFGLLFWSLRCLPLESSGERERERERALEGERERDMDAWMHRWVESQTIDYHNHDFCRF